MPFGYAAFNAQASCQRRDNARHTPTLRIPLIPSEILVQTPPQLMAMIESVARASIFCDCAVHKLLMTARVSREGEVA